MEESHEYDAVIVLGAAVMSDGAPSRALLRRTMHAIDLLKKGDAHFLIACGGSQNELPSEASVIRNIAIDNGISPGKIFLEEDSHTTLQNVINSSAIIKAHGWTRILYATDTYHIKRAGMVFRQFGINAVGSAAPGGFQQNSTFKWLFYYFREFVARAWYRFYLAFLYQEKD